MILFDKINTALKLFLSIDKITLFLTLLCLSIKSTKIKKNIKNGSDSTRSLSQLLAGTQLWFREKKNRLGIQPVWLISVCNLLCSDTVVHSRSFAAVCATIWNLFAHWFSVHPMDRHMQSACGRHVCIFALQVRSRQLAEIPAFPWMAVATGKGGSQATRWPSPVIQDMNCRERAESPASKWKIDTTGNPALQAASVREREAVWVRQRSVRVWSWYRELDGLKQRGAKDVLGISRKERWRGKKRARRLFFFLLTGCNRDYKSLLRLS